MVRNTVRSSAPSVRAASTAARSIEARPRAMFTSGRVTKKMPCETMVAAMCPYSPTICQKIRKPSAETTGGRMKGAMPRV